MTIHPRIYLENGVQDICVFSMNYSCPNTFTLKETSVYPLIAVDSHIKIASSSAEEVNITKKESPSHVTSSKSTLDVSSAGCRCLLAQRA